MGNNSVLLTQLKRFAGDSLLYAFMSVSTKLIAFIMFPLYLDLLVPKEIAAMSVIDSTINILTIFVIFGTDSALAYYYFAEKDLKRKQLYVQHVLSFRLLISLAFSLAVLLFGDWVVQLLKIPNFLFAMQISMFTLIFDSISTLFLTVDRYNGKAIRVVSLTILKMLLIALGSYYLLVEYSRELNQVMYARLISVFLVFLFTGKDFLRYFRISFDKTVMKEIISYAYPLVPASLALWMINGFNRYVIIWLEGKAGIDVAMYETAFRYASVITLVTYGIQMAWRPYSMQIKDHKDAPSLLARIYILVFVIGALGILFVAMLMPWIFEIMIKNKAYYSAYQYVGVLSFALFLSFYYLILSTGLFYTKNTKIISHAFIISSIISIILDFSLYPILGLWGIVIANLITYIVANIIIFAYSQKVYFIPISVSKLVFLLIQTIVTLAAIVYLQIQQYSAWYLVFPWIYFLISLAICRLDLDLRINWK